jgi:hypothetical protein
VAEVDMCVCGLIEVVLHGCVMLLLTLTHSRSVSWYMMDNSDTPSSLARGSHTQPSALMGNHEAAPRGGCRTCCCCCNGSSNGLDVSEVVALALVLEGLRHRDRQREGTTIRI